ncbi:hypothetical protein ElyMa_004831400 [Elysia marginata]|uniref:Uncharacterized protein n=1 Tax=Elysia marginata TaxID=1093978 RepID=A0AAV4IS30_9GAST|nr:hypothetical protein ElyMa_004831400 [Elysia marginata]
MKGENNTGPTNTIRDYFQMSGMHEAVPWRSASGGGSRELLNLELLLLNSTLPVVTRPQALSDTRGIGVSAHSGCTVVRLCREPQLQGCTVKQQMESGLTIHRSLGQRCH